MRRKQWIWFLLFLGINFGSLALGTIAMNNGPTSEWYLSLTKAPWTPPGWVFGAAWTLIMICFSWFLAVLFSQRNTPKIGILFCVHVILNIGWNYVFFNQHFISLGLLVISLLTLLIAFYFVTFEKETQRARFALIPYLVWLVLATSLNAYIVLYN